MGIHAIVGGQWGDEGKGKIADYFSADADIIARYQGGANAGHTVYIDKEQYVLHQVPSGVLRAGTRCLLGTGMVIDPIELASEIKGLEDQGIDCSHQIGIAYNAHLVLPVHKKLDGIAEESKHQTTIGTTKRGIGPTYSDRSARRGLPVSTLLKLSSLEAIVQEHLNYANRIIQQVYDMPAMTIDEFWDDLLEAREKIIPMITDASAELTEGLEQDKKIIAEGAQGVLLDIDYGTYPYVTSSHPGAIGVSAGLGVPPSSISRTTGIFKAYCTRVGEGPFPTEIQDADEKKRLREAGNEYGATTGRPRRCGWFDAVLGRVSARINGFTDLCITKADVLAEFSEVRLCSSYKEQPSGFLNLHSLEKITPRYEKYHGWQDDLSGVSEFSNLPEALQEYLQVIESHLNVPVKMVSTGPERSQILLRD